MLTGNGVRHTNFEVVVIGQRILNSLHQRRSSKDLLRHLVHSRLDRRAVIFRESLESNSARSFPSSIELLKVRLHLGQSTKATPLPVGRDICAEDAVPGFLEGGEFVAEEAPELRPSALQHSQSLDGRVDVDALAFNDVDLHVAGLGARLDE